MVSVTSIAVVLALTVVSANLDGVAANTAQQFRKDQETCGKLLRVPAETLQQYRRSEYPENEETFCYVRCIGILQGHYEDEQGLLGDKLFEAANLGKTREEFTQVLNECQAKVGEDVSSYCQKAYIPLMCFRKHYKEWNKPENYRFGMAVLFEDIS